MGGDPEQRTERAPVRQDLPFQRKQWTVQRWGWGLMGLLLVAALIGLLGAGPLANAGTATADASLRLEYQRFARVQAPDRLAVELASLGEDQAALWIDTGYLERLEIEMIDPEPVEVRGGADRQIFVFAVADDEPALDIWIGYRHETPGRITGRMGVPGGQEITFEQFVYP